jgi:hypothetical protein
VKALVPALAAASALLYCFRDELSDPRRIALALATVGFFWAPASVRPLRLGPWLLGVAAVAWGAQLAGQGRGGFALWLACSIAGAFLVVRGGSRAVCHYLPPAGNEIGAALQRAIRRELQIAIALFLAAYVFGFLAPSAGAIAVVVAAAFFLRYVLLQSKHLGLSAAPILPARGLVPAQKWALLLLFAFVGGTRYAQALLGSEGEGPLLVTAALLSVLGALLFVFSLVRGGWPKPLVRRASFAAGILLAVALTAVLVELESWDRARYRVFASACIVFLVVLPFLKAQTKLFDSHPHLSSLVPPAILSVMMAPSTSMSGTGWSLATTVFLFAFAALMVVYHLMVAFRERGPGKAYLGASLVVLLYVFLNAGGGRAWQVFLLSLGFVLYGVDLYERMGRPSPSREGIEVR